MAGTLTLHCLRPGAGAFLVDGGRPGHRALGIASGGPADERARDAANRLLSRPRHHPCLELTLTGGQWLLSGQGQFALTGADMNWRLNGRLLEAYTVQYLEGDGLLTSTAAVRGLRAYFAVVGAWAVPRVLGSAERGLPGIPSIQAGWHINITWQREAPYQTDLETHQHFPQQPQPIPVIPGPEWGWLTPAQQTSLLGNTYSVSAQSNRQGIRLEGSAKRFKLPAMISSPVLPGTIQLTPSGPIILGPEAQTVGGYPRVLLVANTAALGGGFQVPIGGTIRFTLLP